MIKLKEILISEMPVDTLQTIGDFSKGSSFTNPIDRKLLTNPVSVQKVKDFFKNTTEHFDFYFVNTKFARKHVEVGAVDEHFVFEELQIKPEQLKDGKINKENITVFYTNNQGAERFPMTPWIIAHRMGHVMARSGIHNKDMYSWVEYRNWIDEKFKWILQAYGYNIEDRRGGYDPNGYKRARQYLLAKRHLAETLGTFKSARDKNLREEFEFGYEWFAQYLNKGSTPLNPLPDALTLGYGPYGSQNKYRLEDKEQAASAWGELVSDGHYYMENVITEAVGKIFVM